MLRSLKWWMPTAAMTLLSLLSYLDRNVLAILSQSILHETGLSAEQYGWIISAFSAAYLVGNPFWGRVLDRFGVRVGLALAVGLWTCASVSHAFATTAVTFALARAALGFGEGATFPGGLRTATQTLRPDQRARGVALAYSGGSMGAILTPILVTPIALRWGWRGAFVLTGLLGVAWLGAWSLVSRDPRVRERREARPEAETAATVGSSSVPRPAPRITDRRVWGFMAAYAFGGLPLGFVLYGAPLHLGRGLGCDQAMLGRLLWIPPAGWEIGYFFWGALVDRAARRGTLDRARFARLFGLLTVLALPLAATPYLRSKAGVMVLLFLAMFVSAGFVIASLAETTRRHSVSHGAYLAGLGAGSWSGLMALMMPIFGRLFDHANFPRAYAIAAVAPAVGYVAWQLATPRREALGGAEPAPSP